jgi:syntaxin-binding protein 5
VDLRGPDVLLREGFTEDGLKVKKKKKDGQNLPAESSSCVALNWAICKMNGESQRTLRLVASYTKGLVTLSYRWRKNRLLALPCSLTKIYTLHSVLGEWVVDSKAVTFSHESLVNPVATFLLSYATGDAVNATSEALRQSMSLQNSLEKSSNKQDGKIPFAAWIVVAKRAMRVQLDLNGDRIAKVDIPEGESIESAYIIRKNGKRRERSSIRK